jgi:hypothetical protein
MSLTLLLLMGGIGCAQTVDRPDDSHKPIQLPGVYSKFSEADVLQKIFEGYDPATQRDSTIRNSENQPTKVSILEAKIWRPATDEYLVVLTTLAGSSEVLCGNCTMDTPLAVLKADGPRLSLIAKQSFPRSYLTDEPISEIFGALSYDGHESIALDLAPYHLTDGETLIGVRIEHMWLPAPIYETNLLLFRVENQRLRKVFQTTVVDRKYPNAHKGGPQTILKTNSKLSTVPRGGQFFDLLVKKATFKCLENDEGDCDPKTVPGKPVKTQTEVWRFDGERFTRKPRNDGGIQRPTR